MHFEHLEPPRVLFTESVTAAEARDGEYHIRFDRQLRSELIPPSQESNLTPSTTP